MMRGKSAKRLIALACAGALWVSGETRRASAEGNWGFGSDLGLTAGTVNDTVFTLGFNLDYYVDRNFSFGPMMLISPTGDLFQIAVAGVGKYHVHLKNGINLVPFTGIGLIHASLDQGAGPSRIDRNDTSWYIPLGLSLEYQVVRNIALSSTLLVNLYDINLSPSLPEMDHNSVSLLFGIRWGP
jgi:hypothetical protein